MEQFVLDESGVRYFRYAAIDARKVRASAWHLCGELQRHFSHSSYADSGLAFESQDEGARVMCLVKTPFSEARLVLDWIRGDQGIDGKLVAERKRLGEDDRPLWQPVYSIVVPSNEENPYVEVGDSRRHLYIHQGSDEQHFLSIRNVGMSIYAGVLGGSR